jgi:hypothetical protein
VSRRFLPSNRIARLQETGRLRGSARRYFD